jgi:hypothetical protein
LKREEPLLNGELKDQLREDMLEIELLVDQWLQDILLIHTQTVLSIPVLLWLINPELSQRMIKKKRKNEH